ncbi:MAG: hypothetical protein GEU80_13320 [Dehalococcoidia bacterium]|nr:hypothetical protein [Dehalococcoidia bacterium]
MSSNHRFSRVLVVAFAALMSLLVLTGCDRAGEFIPGSDGASPTPDPSVLPTSGSSPDGPILVTPALETRPGDNTGGPEGIPDHELARSVVQVRLLESADGGDIVRDGSGVVVDQERGLILTSYPLVYPYQADGSAAYAVISIAHSSAPGVEPEPRFRARIVVADAAARLAVLRVEEDAAGEPLEAGAFDLPAVRLADPGSTISGDSVRLFGHPGIALEGVPTQAVVTTEAAVTGFRGDPLVSGRAWVKSGARPPYGTSGGPAVDSGGELVGILLQEAYSPGSPVGSIRAMEVARPLVEQAQNNPDADYVAALSSRGGGAGTGASATDDGIWVAQPAFAENAVDQSTSRELFDYGQRFDAGLGTLYYEFVAQGIENGTVVEERWFLDGVQQDRLSSTAPWEGGAFGVVSERIIAPNSGGLPSGRWRLEVWVDGSMRASSTALVGVDPPSPSLSEFSLGSRATPERTVLAEPSADARQLLASFKYAGMEGAQTMRWIVFRNGRVVHQSPSIPWTGGTAGNWWVGYSADEAVGAGTWEIEIYVDDQVMGRTEPLTLE